VLNSEERVGQTTQGIWFAYNKQYQICILDCEGTDSKERGEERGKFEHCSSLFALSLSDVLVINMWSSVTKSINSGCRTVHSLKLWCIKNSF
jgi:protein SEY1